MHVLRLLPTCEPRLIVDAGCGTGRQTLVLAREPGTVIDAIDSHSPFLDDHPDPAVREFTRETLKEIEPFEPSEDSYGYVFYALRRG